MYINFMNQENKNICIYYWLLLITSLVVLMIIVGGLTRLTDSGLSITRWDLISGIIPPFTLSDWEKSFSLYKQIPEYKLINYSMSLEQFKVIYWWEYIHRLLGRIIGLFYLLPLLYFTYKGFINKKSLISFYLILTLIIFQGFIGWYMVKSGLTERTDVSHYRLALHLFLAFIILILLLFNFLKYSKIEISEINNRIPFYLPEIFLFFLLIQIIIGALVSGLDAGQIYQSWPLMNESFFPNDSKVGELLSTQVLEIPSLVQFLHRNMAYLLILFFVCIAIITFKNDDLIHLRKSIVIISISLLLQIVLGIFTVITGAGIIISSLHQIGSIILISSVVLLIYKNSNLANSF